MKEKNLLTLALICSLFGILLILFISESIEIKTIKISNITKDLLDKEVKVEATITNIKETPGLLIFTIKDETGYLPALLFKEEPLDLKTNDKVEIMGTIIEYKTQLEIQINQIRKL